MSPLPSLGFAGGSATSGASGPFGNVSVTGGGGNQVVGSGSASSGLNWKFLAVVGAALLVGLALWVNRKH